MRRIAGDLRRAVARDSLPDFAGWRRERMPQLPVEKAYFDLAPDWICEVLSPSSASLDRGEKLKVWRAFEVAHVWFVDPEACTLEILEKDAHGYRVFDVFSGTNPVRAVPFDAIELELGALWARQVLRRARNCAACPPDQRPGSSGVAGRTRAAAFQELCVDHVLWSPGSSLVRDQMFERNDFEANVVDLELDRVSE